MTAVRILHPSFFATMSEVPRSESNPPFYYALAWLWSLVFGKGEIGLRSLSALCGVATIPVVFLIGARVLSQRAGLIAAAIVATNPILIWYSQDVRNYALVVLLASCSVLALLLALERPSGRRLAVWAAVSALAIVTHYFAAFLIAVEALALLARRPRWRREVLFAVGAVALAACLVLPLAIHQAGPRNHFIGKTSLLGRLAQIAVKFGASEGRGPAGGSVDATYGLVPIALALAGFALLARDRITRSLPSLRLLAALGAGALLIPVGFALVGSDFVDTRNLLFIYVPLTLLMAAGFASGRLGLGLAAALCVYSIAFGVYYDTHPRLQREDWRAVGRVIGPAPEPRLILAPRYGNAPLRYYIGATPLLGQPRPVREVVVVAWGSPSAAAIRRLSPALIAGMRRPASYDFTVTILRSPRPVRLAASKLKGLGLIAADRNAVPFIQNPPR